jgi:hypothetical protein
MEIGVNIPWFANGYGHDLGPNLYLPNWPVTFDVTRAETLLQSLVGFGIRLVRLWLCEYSEGLVWNSSLKVTGVHPTFLNNISTLASLLKEREMLAYWTILDANSVLRNRDFITYSILTSTSHADAFSETALPHILQQIAPVAWAIDLCNEPEAILHGALGNSTRFGVQSAVITKPLKTMLATVRRILPWVRVSFGSGYTEGRTFRDNTSLADLGLLLDFVDYHSYASDPFHKLSLAPSYLVQKPWIVGELGYEIPDKLRNDRAIWAVKQKELERRLYVLQDYDYHAVFLWYISDNEIPDGTALVFDGEVGRTLHTARLLLNE